MGLGSLKVSLAGPHGRAGVLAGFSSLMPAPPTQSCRLVWGDGEKCDPGEEQGRAVLGHSGVSRSWGSERREWVRSGLRPEGKPPQG